MSNVLPIGSHKRPDELSFRPGDRVCIRNQPIRVFIVEACKIINNKELVVMNGCDCGEPHIASAFELALMCLE